MWFDRIRLTVDLLEVDIFLLIAYKMSKVWILSSMSLSVASTKRRKKFKYMPGKKKKNHSTVKKFKLMDSKILIVFSQQSRVHK